jgi:hypothetical protein
MKRIGWSLLLTTATTCALLVVTAPGASADPYGDTAGYSAAPSAAPTQAASATFTVPKATCTHVPVGGTQYVVYGVRFDFSGAGPNGYNYNSDVGVYVTCQHAGPSYQSVFEVPGSSIYDTVSVRPGDMVTASTSEGSAGTTLTLTDGSQTDTKTMPVFSVVSIDVGAFVDGCSSSGCLPVPDMTKSNFTSVSINGTNLTAAGATRSKIVDRSGVTEMKSTVGTADSFAVKWEFSCSNGRRSC